MTKQEAAEWVTDHSEDDELDQSELAAAFAALFERMPDDEDVAEGLWSHLCAYIEAY